MLHFDIVREAKPAKSFRVASVIGTFDLQTDQVKEHFVGDIEVEPDGDWQIGLIVGNSGTGKTTIAKERIESELRIARDIQMSMVPRKFDIFQQHPGVDLYASMTPAREAKA